MCDPKKTAPFGAVSLGPIFLIFGFWLDEVLIFFFIEDLRERIFRDCPFLLILFFVVVKCHVACLKLLTRLYYAPSPLVQVHT